MPLHLQTFGDMDLYYTERYKVLIRSNKELLIETATTVPLLDRVNVYAFRYDIYRLLRSLNVEQHMFWTNAFINDIINPNQDISNLKEIKIANEQVISKMIARSNTVKE